MISYDGWDREYLENREAYLSMFDRFMSQTNYENNEEFEHNFANMIGRTHAISVSNATDALHFALLAHGIGPGDEVIVPDFSWISSAACISMVGATPVFCDIELGSYHIDIESIERMHSDKTKAVVYVHLFGNMTDTSEIEFYCKQHGLLFIEDAAQSLGSSLDGIKAGTIGDSSVYSFNSNKVISGINGGGVLLTDDDKIASTVKKIRRHGRDKDFSMLGFNSRMYVLNAEVINLRMMHMEKNQTRRQEIASMYSDAFKDLPVHVQTMSGGLNHNYHKYTVRLEDKSTRDIVRGSVNASIHYETPLASNSMYEKVLHRKDQCVNSKLVSDTILSLPIHAWMREDEVGSIIQLVKSTL